MPVSFPALRPVERQYTPGRFPTKRFASLSGFVTTRLYGSRANEATLSLKFATTDAEAASVVTAFMSARGDADYLTIPAQTWEGATGGLSTAGPAYVRWKFDGPPVVTSVFPGRSEVSVQLVGLLEA